MGNFVNREEHLKFERIIDCFVPITVGIVNDIQPNPYSSQV